MTRGERSVKQKRRQNSNRTRIIAGSLARALPSYSKANLEIIHTESLFAGYIVMTLKCRLMTLIFACLCFKKSLLINIYYCTIDNDYKYKRNCAVPVTGCLS